MLQTRSLATLIAVAMLLAAAVGVQAAPGQQSAAVKSQSRPSGSNGASAALTELARWRPAQAREQLVAAGAASSESSTLRSAWGVLLEVEGKPDDALAALDQAVALDAADFQAHFYRGEVLYGQQRQGDAKAEWQKARDRASSRVNADSGDAAAQFVLGAAKVRLQQYPKAREALEAAASAGFDQAMVKYQMGLSHAFEQNWQQSVDLLTATLGIDGGFAHAYYYRGLCWDKLGRKDKMLSDLDRFVSLAPKAPEAERAVAILQAAGR